jgi:ABC-type uncharacterized transport system ATPase component
MSRAPEAGSRLPMMDGGEIIPDIDREEKSRLSGCGPAF